VRGQALFWLAQKAGEKATATIDKALRDDPDDEVRVKAVFALSQLPKDEGIPRLIRLARSHQSAEVREQAFFWLGQSRDRRALDFIEDVLTR
jgi:HEAT repeat protein